jgi:hypothetical protein
MKGDEVSPVIALTADASMPVISVRILSGLNINSTLSSLFNIQSFAMTTLR